MHTDNVRPDVTIVIVHFETPELLQQSLAALQGGVGAHLEVIVIDNASRSFDSASLEQAFPGTHVINNPRNVGFAVASNQGLRIARGRYVLLLNPDTIVGPYTLSKMVAYMDAHPEVGCATARLVLEDGRLDLACRRSFPSPATAFFRLSLLSRLFPRSRRFGRYNLTYVDDRAETEIDSPCGAFMMVRAEIRDSVGVLDESYFMYGEDLDWAFRIKQAGWRVMYYPGATAVHLKRASSSQVRMRTVRAFYDAMRIFYRRHYERDYPRLVSWLIYRAIDTREAVELMAARLRPTARGAKS